MRFNGFKFEDSECFQHHGLAMGSPLSPVGACLYLEWLEKEHYLEIMGPETLWMRYIDDVLIVIPRDMNLEEKVRNLNDVDAKNQFTVEKKANSSLPFLDTFIFREGQKVKYKVYRKPSCKEDYTLAQPGLARISARLSLVRGSVQLGTARLGTALFGAHIGSARDFVLSLVWFGSALARGLGYGEAGKK